MGRLRLYRGAAKNLRVPGERLAVGQQEVDLHTGQRKRQDQLLHGHALAVRRNRDLMRERAPVSQGVVERAPGGPAIEIGRASCRARVWKEMEISVVAVTVTQKKIS